MPTGKHRDSLGTYSVADNELQNPNNDLSDSTIEYYNPDNNIGCLHSTRLEVNQRYHKDTRSECKQPQRRRIGKGSTFRRYAHLLARGHSRQPLQVDIGRLAVGGRRDRHRGSKGYKDRIEENSAAAASKGTKTKLYERSAGAWLLMARNTTW